MPFPRRALRRLASALALAVALALVLAPTASAQIWNPDDGDVPQQLEQTRESLRQHRAALDKARAAEDWSRVGALERDIAAEEALERKLMQKLGQIPPDPPPTTLQEQPESIGVPGFDTKLDIFWTQVQRDWESVQEQLGVPGAKERREELDKRLRELKGEPEPAKDDQAPADDPPPAEQREPDGQSEGQGTGEGGKTTPEQSLEAVIIGDGLGDGGEPGTDGTGEPLVTGGAGGRAPKVGTPAARPDDQEPDGTDGTTSKMTIEEPGLTGTGPGGGGPCSLPADLRVFCPPDDTGDSGVRVNVPDDTGTGDVLVDLPGRVPTGPRTTPPADDLPGTTGGPCPALDGLLGMCDPGQGGSSVRLQTGTVTLDPTTRGNLSDLFKPNTNPNATAVLPVVPAGPGLLLPAALTTTDKRHQSDDGHGDQPSLFANVDPVITVADTGTATATGTATGAVTGAVEQVAGAGGQVEQPGGEVGSVGGLVTGAGSGLATGAGGTVTQTTSAPVAPAAPSEAAELLPVCDPGVPC